MKPALIEATTIEDSYFQLIAQCYENGVKYEITEGSFKGSYRVELPFAAGFIEYPHTRPLAPIMPEGVPPVTADEKIEEYFYTYLMDSKLLPNEEYRYATWINGKYINPCRLDSYGDPEVTTQLDWCIRHFQEKGYGNNHCFITVGEPTVNFNYDAPYDNEHERRTSPCLRGIDIKIKEDKVILGIIYRSWDLYAGFPENMGGFALLNQYIADQLEIEAGPLTFSSQGLHIYSHQVEPVLAYLRK
jgi:thymidylate synthase